MKVELRRGQALVLAGPEGCGKTTAAREIAAPHGKPVEVFLNDLDNPFRLGAMLRLKAPVAIVEGAPVSRAGSMTLFAIIGRPTFAAAGRGVEDEVMPTPHLIFCAQAGDDLRFVRHHPSWFRLLEWDETQKVFC